MIRKEDESERGCQTMRVSDVAVDGERRSLIRMSDWMMSIDLCVCVTTERRGGRTFDSVTRDNIFADDWNRMKRREREREREDEKRRMK